jgi:ribose/xylose/arabinose/galactoside ABC-type transport system permease subunit
VPVVFLLKQDTWETMNKPAIDIAETILLKVILANRAAFFALMLAGVLAFASPYFLTTQNLFNVLDQVVVFTAVALAATFVLGAGDIDLSIIGIVPLVGAFVAWLMVDGGFPVSGAILIGLLLGALCGMLNAALIALLRLPSFIVTLATGAIFQGIMFVITNMTPITNLPESFVFLGQGRVGPFTIPTLVLVPLIVAMVVLQRSSVFAQHVVALANNPEAVRVAGISTNWLRFKLFTIMGLFAGLAGILLTARSASAQVGAGANLLLLVVAAVVIGGTPITGGRLMMLGTVFGSLTIGMINNGLNLVGFPTTFQTATQGLVILLALYSDSRTTHIQNRIAKRAIRRELEQAK